MCQPGGFRRGLHSSIILLALFAPLSAQQAPEDFSALRDKALQLIHQGNQVAALPLLEKLAEMRPEDVEVLERLGGSLFASTTEIMDPAEKKKVALRARSVFLRAKELGDDSGYLQVMLEIVPENGELGAFSTNQEVEKAMTEGEEAFVKANFPAALKAYQRALALDPHTYSAALFIGDVYFNMNQIDKAGEWFAQAIEIDPNRETAYRYWADGLMKEGKMAEARVKFVEAVVAEPYAKAPWVNLKKWGDYNNAKLTHPRIESKGSVTAQGDKITINIDPNSLGKDGEGSYWLIYPILRAGWQGEKFKKEFPEEKEYRHSLREEAEALGSVARLVAKDAADPAKKSKIDPDLLALAKINDQGFLESYVLISRADQGIAQDYSAYRAEHRAKIVQYINEWIISMDPAKK